MFYLKFLQHQSFISIIGRMEVLFCPSVSVNKITEKVENVFSLASGAVWGAYVHT